MKKLLIIILIPIIVISLIITGKNIIAKTAVSQGVEAVTGLQLDIDSLDVGILTTFISVQDMKLYNPPDFPEKLMVEMPEIYVDYRLGSFLARKAHLEEIRIHLSRLTVIKDKNGALNIDALKMVKDKKAPHKTQATDGTDLKIDRLDLKIGTVSYRDYSKGSAPRSREYRLDIHETFEHITDLDEMARVIMLKALLNTNIADLANFDLGTLSTGVAETLRKTTELGTPLKEAGEQAGQAIKEVAGGITKKLKLPLQK